MPSVPPGTVTRTVVSGMNPVAGVNVAVSPDTCQLPLTDGESVGSGVCGDSAVENFTVIGAAPFASCAPPAGVTEITFSGTTGAAFGFVFVVTCWVVAGLLLLTLASVSWPDIRGRRRERAPHHQHRSGRARCGRDHPMLQQCPARAANAARTPQKRHSSALLVVRPRWMIPVRLSMVGRT